MIITQAQTVMRLAIELTQAGVADVYTHFEAHTLTLTVRAYPVTGVGIELIPPALIGLTGNGAQAHLERVIGQLEALRREEAA